MAFHALIPCMSCVYRLITPDATLRAAPIQEPPDQRSLLVKPVPERPATALHWALASLCLTMLMPSLDTSIANAALPTLAQAFTASFQSVQWVVIAYLLAITTLIVFAGRLGDIVGRRRLLLTGITLFTIASLLCGLAPTLPLLIAARAVQGIGAAMMLALTVALVGETVPSNRIGSAMGLLGTMSAIGTTLGPSLGGTLIAAVGWRTIFLVNVPLGALNLILAHRFLPADTPAPLATRPRFDIPGTLLLALSLAAYALAMTLGRGHFGALNIALLIAAAIGTFFFVRVEASAASPLIRPKMFRDHALAAGLAMNILVTTVVMATLVVGPFYLSQGLGLSTAATGLVLSIGPLVSALTGIPAGRAVDRLGSHRITMTGLGAMGTGATLIALIPSRFGLGAYLPSIAIITSGYALFQAANNTAIMSDTRANQRGVIAGMLSLSRNLGLITGASAMGAVFALGLSGTSVLAANSSAIASGMHTTFGVAAALIVVALAIASASAARLRHTAHLKATETTLTLARIPE